MFRSIKNKLIFLFLIAVLTPLLVMRLIAYPSAKKAIQETTISNLQLIGSKKASQVVDWLQRVKSEAGRAAHNPFVVSAVNLTKTDTDAISQFLSHIPRDAGFLRYVICDASGIVRISTDDKLIGLNLADADGFSHAIGGKAYVSDIEPFVFSDANAFGNRADRLPVMHVSVPVRNKDGRVLGVMIFQIDPSVLVREMQER